MMTIATMVTMMGDDGDDLASPYPKNLAIFGRNMNQIKSNQNNKMKHNGVASWFPISGGNG